MRLVVGARLIQTFRQYPRAGLLLSFSCRKALDEAVAKNVLDPGELNAKVLRVADNDGWSLQTKLAWMDIFSWYKSDYQSNDCQHNKEMIGAIVEGILATNQTGKET